MNGRGSAWPLVCCWLRAISPANHRSGMLCVPSPASAACLRQVAARLPRRQRRAVAAAAAAAPDAPPRRVVVTGQGVVSSLGHSADEFYNNLLAGKSGISMIEGWDTCEWPAGACCPSCHQLFAARMWPAQVRALRVANAYGALPSATRAAPPQRRSDGAAHPGWAPCAAAGAGVGALPRCPAASSLSAPGLQPTSAPALRGRLRTSLTATASWLRSGRSEWMPSCGASGATCGPAEGAGLLAGGPPWDNHQFLRPQAACNNAGRQRPIDGARSRSSSMLRVGGDPGRHSAHLRGWCGGAVPCSGPGPAAEAPTSWSWSAPASCPFDGPTPQQSTTPTSTPPPPPTSVHPHSQPHTHSYITPPTPPHQSGT